VIFLIVILGFVVFLIWNQQNWQVLPWPEKALKLPLFQGHRGYHDKEKENTLAAFRAAKARGAEMVELDVQLSKDHVVVVFHDKDLQRLANDAGLLKDFTAAELKQKAQAPTLFEVLSDPLVPGKVNIEIKTDAVFNSDLEKAVAKVVQEARAESRVLISSFNPLSLYKMSVLLPDVPRALLASNDPSPGNRFYLKRKWLAPYVRVHLLHLDYRDVTTAKIKKYQKRQIPVALWTVDEVSTAQSFLEAGAVSIISDVILKESDLKA
jgi:glycerophosphoryl diester phosphodiesterase